MTDETNRHVIRDRLPNAYLPELIETNGREAVESLLASHFVSTSALEILLRDPFGPEDFEAFIRERQRTIKAAIQSLLLGGRAHLPADLRELDEDIERIELSLRKLVAARLDNDRALWPHHLREKLDARIAGALKKNPGLDEADFESLERALEFADLSELFDAIVAKAVSPRFSDVFPTRESLQVKFAQLGELRNGIRHSRTVSDVARHEGQAAIHWFDAALAKTDKSVLA